MMTNHCCWASSIPLGMRNTNWVMYSDIAAFAQMLTIGSLLKASRLNSSLIGGMLNCKLLMLIWKTVLLEMKGVGELPAPMSIPLRMTTPPGLSADRTHLLPHRQTN